MSDKAKDLLKTDWLPTYNTQLDLLWYQAVQLNSNLYLLERIATFPFDMFAVWDQLCWSLIARSLYESCIMSIWRIVADTGSDILGLRQFKNEVLRQATDGRARDHIRRRLEAASFEKRVTKIQAAVKELRHNWLGHLMRDSVSREHASGRGMPIVPVGTLETVRDAVNEIITALSFDSGRAFTYPEYSSNVIYPTTGDSRPDIERVLDLVARSSPVLSMPEDMPDVWQHSRNALSEKELEQYNIYRKKFGLPPA